MTVMIILSGGIFTKSVMADPVTIVLGSLNGFVNPITYTTAAGTFTTGTIMLSLSGSSPSFFVMDQATGAITAHTVIDVKFDDGRGNLLSGVLTVDEEGTLGSAGDPIFMNISNGTLLGAGDFSGSHVRGINTIILRRLGIDCPDCEWFWGPIDPAPQPGDPPRFPITLTLPAGFINGDNIVTSGEAHACTVPEPATLVLLTTGLAGIAGAVRKRRNSRSKTSRPCRRS